VAHSITPVFTSVLHEELEPALNVFVDLIDGQTEVGRPQQSQINKFTVGVVGFDNGVISSIQALVNSDKLIHDLT